MLYPKISIVTPSYNQGHFIEETILSVLGQDYPNLEYIIIDGGSNDNTVEIIKKYQHRLAYWVSEKDNGQSHAINKGFKIATGEILGWLNSDDLYMPNILGFVADQLKDNKDKILIGNCLHFRESENQGLYSWGSDTVLCAETYKLEQIDFIVQPSSFWSRKLWLSNGVLLEDFHFGFDWEWFLRAQTNGFSFNAVHKCLSLYRFHDNHKSSTGKTKRQQELLKIYAIYSPKYEKLYKKLIICNYDSNTIKIRVFKKLLYIFKLQLNQSKVLKLLYPNNFKHFKSNEIEKVSRML